MRWLLVLTLLCTSCSTVGVLPSAPLTAPHDTDCTPLVDYAHQLSEAYRARASANRFAVYVAGVAAIGTAAAIGGLASSGTSDPGTIATISLSGATLAAVMMLFDNQGLAGIYTVAANRIDTAVVARPVSCEALLNEITAARNELEAARTGSTASDPVLQ